MFKPTEPRRHGHSHRLGLAGSILVLSWLLCPGSFSAVPTLDNLFPIALQAGTTNSVTAAGKFDPWPPKIWVDAPGIGFRSETNNGQFMLEMPAGAPVGPHLIRAFNEQGASALHYVVVTGEPQQSEQEPNDDFRHPQVLECSPAWVNGRLDKSGDVDSFGIALEAGQTLVAELEAYTLGSPVDAVLRLVDSRGLQRAYNHDDGRTLDPLLVWTASSPGNYVLQVFGFAYPATSDIQFTGGKACVYRLHLSKGPCLWHTLPLGVQRGAVTALQLFGWNLGPKNEGSLEFDGTHLEPHSTAVSFKNAVFENAPVLPVGDGPETIEIEPNDSIAEATRVAVPSAVTGCIEKIDDEDRFRFEAKKGETFVIEIESASLGFPLDARMKIEDAQGKELAADDDSESADPEVEWTVPEDGTFNVAVTSALHRGGADHLYRLSIRRAFPALKATVAESAFSVQAGKTNEIKVALKRLHGFQSKLTISTKGLPDDVKAEPVEVPEKGGDITLKLAAAAEAKPFSGVFQIIATELESRQEHRVVHPLITTGVNNGVPNGFRKLLIESTDQLWLTLLPVSDSKADAGK